VPDETHQIPLTRIQKLIGRRMLQSKRTKPCFYIESKADVTELMAIRRKLRKSLGVRITTNTFYIRVLGLAAQKFPLTMGRFDGDCIGFAEEMNVGFAVNAPQGLVVPVVKHADRKTLPEIAREEKRLTDKARDNKLTLEEMEGETHRLEQSRRVRHGFVSRDCTASGDRHPCRGQCDTHDCPAGR